MQHLTIEPIRWTPFPAQVSILPDNSHPKVYYQILSPMNVKGMCIGRPAEELPRILSVLSCSHHIVSAMALDRLFGVEPPPPAVNMREGLLRCQYAVSHLRKLYFMLCARQHPFADFRRSDDPEASALEHDIMHHLALCQEAAAILGARPDHPVTAVAGGVSRFLKEVQYKRLPEIADACAAFAPRLKREFVKFTCDNGISPAPMKSLTLSKDSENVIVKDPNGNETGRFPAGETADRIRLRSESWTYMPFAEIRTPSSDQSEPFFVGPAARREQNAGGQFSDPWSLLISEFAQSADKMKLLFTEDALTGPAFRTIPSGIGSKGAAGIEAPEGFIFHEYHADAQGIIKDLFVLDSSVSNNFLRCRIAESVATHCLSAGVSETELKARLELSLLPF